MGTPPVMARTACSIDVKTKRAFLQAGLFYAPVLYVVGVGVRGLGLRVTPVWPLLVDFGGSLDAVSVNSHCGWLVAAGWMLRRGGERVRGVAAVTHA